MTATSNRHRRPVTSGRAGPKLLGAFASSGYCAGRRTTPSGTTPSRTSRHKAIRSLRAKATIMSLRSAGSSGAGSKPLRQGAVLLEHEKSPRQLDHASSNPSVARTGQPFLLAFSATLVGRAREAGIARYGPSVALFRDSTSCTSMWPSRCQCPSHAPAGAPWHALPRRAPARGDPGVRSRLLDLSRTSRRRSMSRYSSDNVLGGIGSPSGVRKPSSRSAAFFSLGLKPRMPCHQCRLDSVMIRLALRRDFRARGWAACHLRP